MTIPSISIGSASDVVSVINRGLGGRRRQLIVLVAFGGIFVDAYDFTSLGFGVVQLKQQLHLDPVQLGTLAASMTGGAVLGAATGGFFIDKVGRLPMFLIGLVLLVVAAFGAAVATNLPMLIAFRLLMGVGVGLDYPVALTFIAEYNALRQRPRAVNLHSPVWNLAAITGFLLLIPLYALGVGDNLWRWSVGLGGLFALILLVLRFMYLSESPMWSAVHGDIDTAAANLRRDYDVTVELQVGSSFDHRLDPIRRSNYLRLFDARYRRRTVQLSVMASTQSLAYFAVGFYLPSISLILFGNHIILAILGSLFFTSFGLVAGIAQALLARRVGMLRLAIVGYAVVFLASVSLGFGRLALPLSMVVALIALFIAFNNVAGAQSMGMAAISYPTSIRGIGTGWTQATLRLGSLVGSYLFPLALTALGLDRMFLLLAVAPAVGLLACAVLRWDPTRREDVDRDDFVDVRVENRPPRTLR